MYRLVIFLFVSLLFGGCSLTSSPPPEEEGVTLPVVKPDLASEPITLEVWLDLDFTRDNTLYEELADEFEKAYPNVEVEIFSFVRESIPRRVELAVLNDESPDVVLGHVFAMAGQGLAEPLAREWTSWQEEDPETTSQFLAAALEEVTWQGQPYGIPLDIYTIILLYNQEHFDLAGMPYPAGDYDLFFLQQAAAVLTDPEQERYGLGVTTDPWYASAWIASAGGDLVVQQSESNYELSLDASINVEALRYLTELVEAGYAPQPSSRPRDYEDARRQFLEGQVSMYFGEPQDIHLIQSTQPDFPLGVAQLPKTPAGGRSASVLGTSGLFIPKGARHPEVAFEFMKWIVSDKYVIPMARRQGRFPAKVWLQTSPDFTKNLSLIPFFNQLETAQPYRLDLFPESEEAFSDAIKSAFYNLETPLDALQKAQLGELNTAVEVGQ